MVQCFHSLGHESVISSNNEHDNIGNVSTACTHLCKGFVSRGINKGNGLSVELSNRSTDVLGNTAGFTASHICLTDPVLQRGLAVVNVAHEGHNRRTGLEIFRISGGDCCIFRFDCFCFVLCGSGICFAADTESDSAFFCKFDCNFSINSLVDGCKHVHHHESGNDFVGAFSESIRQCLDNDRRSHCDFRSRCTFGRTLIFTGFFLLSAFHFFLKFGNNDFNQLDLVLRNRGGCTGDIFISLFLEFFYDIFRGQAVFTGKILYFQSFCCHVSYSDLPASGF